MQPDFTEQQLFLAGAAFLAGAFLAGFLAAFLATFFGAAFFTVFLAAFFTILAISRKGHVSNLEI